MVLFLIHSIFLFPDKNYSMTLSLVLLALVLWSLALRSLALWSLVLLSLPCERDAAICKKLAAPASFPVRPEILCLLR